MRVSFSMLDDRWRPRAKLGALGVFAFMVLAGAAAIADTDLPANPLINSPSAPAAGRQVFDAGCAACHGTGATGGRGPALNVGVFNHGSSDSDLFQTIRDGVPGTQMPSFASLPTDKIWQLITYIRSLSGGGATLTGDPVKGRALFLQIGSCVACHDLNGQGGGLASDLGDLQNKSATSVRIGILHRGSYRGQGITPPYFAEILANDGRKLQGMVLAADGVALWLKQKAKTTLLEVTEIRSQHISVQPSALLAHISKAQVEDLVAYLSHENAANQLATPRASPATILPYSRINNPARGDWPTYWGTYRSEHFSALKEITASNVTQLHARWAATLPGESALESTPLVVDGIMYVTGPPGDVYAFDARDGLLLWKFHRKQDVRNPYQNNPFNRGVAILDGRLFLGTLDDNLIALDAHTGRELWEKRIADTLGGYTLTGAPLALKDRIIVGMSGGELGVRGFIDAYDPITGKQLWRLHTVPSAGEKGSDTWPGQSWNYGGAATWLTGSYDAETDTLYWSTGNPGPDYNPDLRKGDNLYSDSVLAIDPNSGKIKWHYQFTPNDGHDWDSQEALVLADQTIDHHPRKLLLHADRNGMFYVLDRVTGRFLWAKPFVHQTWNLGFDARGRPIINPSSLPTPQGVTLFPGVSATNFGAPSYDPFSGKFFLHYLSMRGFAQSAPVTYERGKLFLGRGGDPAPDGPAPEQGIEALDSHDGNILWKFPLTRFGSPCGLLATKGGLLFAATMDGELLALSTKTGKLLWHFRAGVPITASPMSYEAYGHQMIAVSAGNQLYAFALPETGTQRRRSN